MNGIEEWELSIIPGNDRTKGNTEGNVPVVFSQSLSNIERTSYSVKRANYKNVAYVAGEGEDEDRKWYEVYSDDSEQNKTGWQRKELWIDARDVQSEAEGNTLTDAEYEEAIEQRANEKFSEAKVSETYSGTIVEANKQYKLGVDYDKGDFVTIVDDELGITIDVQITEITKSVEGSREIVDVGYVYGTVKRDVPNRVDKIESEVESTKNDIKYIEREVGKLIGNLKIVDMFLCTLLYDTPDDHQTIHTCIGVVSREKDLTGCSFIFCFIRSYYCVPISHPVITRQEGGSLTIQQQYRNISEERHTFSGEIYVIAYKD